MVETGKSNKELFTMLEIAKILDTLKSTVKYRYMLRN